MAGDSPTTWILATSAPFATADGATAGRLARLAVEVAGTNGRAPKVCYLGTARGDQRDRIDTTLAAGSAAGFTMSHLALFPQPNVSDIAAFLADQDVIWVGGGSVANLLAVWAVHDIGTALRAAGAGGTILAGHSAGSICWTVGGLTDSYGPNLRVVDNGLGFVPYGNGVHYDSEQTRRPAVHAAVAAGALPETHCTDDGVGLLYANGMLATAVGDRSAGGAYRVTADAGAVAEVELDVHRLG